MNPTYRGINCSPRERERTREDENCIRQILASIKEELQDRRDPETLQGTLFRAHSCPYEIRPFRTSNTEITWISPALFAWDFNGKIELRLGNAFDVSSGSQLKLRHVLRNARFSVINTA